jgi:hypothetical protein
MPPAKSATRRARAPRRAPKARPAGVRREDLNRLMDLLEERTEMMKNIVRTQEIQFQRIAQMQAEIDLLKRTRGRG